MINVINNEAGVWEVWSDTEVAKCDGRCLSVGSSKADAISKAVVELRDELQRLCQHAPCTQVADMFPLVLYFDCKEAADSFEAIVRAAKPNLVETKL